MLGTVSKLFYIKHYDWIIMMSSKISLVHLKNCLPSWTSCGFLFDNFSNELMTFLMTSLWTNQNALHRIIWRRSFNMLDSFLLLPFAFRRNSSRKPLSNNFLSKTGSKLARQPHDLRICTT